MPDKITYYSVKFYKKTAHGGFETKPTMGFTSDEDLNKEVMDIAGYEVKDNTETRRWFATDDQSLKGTANDVAALKEKCAESGGLAEETSKGCWSSYGCKFGDCAW
jgi:hypothetical protein